MQCSNGLKKKHFEDENQSKIKTKKIKKFNVNTRFILIKQNAA